MEINFDATIEDVGNTGFEPIPEGEYRLMLIECDLLPNSKGTGDNLKCKLQVVGPKFEGRILWENFCWTHSTSEKAVQIARSRFASLCSAIGISVVKDTDELLNISFLAEVGVKTSEGFGPQNFIKKYISAVGKSSDAVEPAPSEDIPF
jgi:hypothetical protein